MFCALLFVDALSKLMLTDILDFIKFLSARLACEILCSADKLRKRATAKRKQKTKMKSENSNERGGTCKH